MSGSGKTERRKAAAAKAPVRAVIEAVMPAVDGGRFPIKRVLGEQWVNHWGKHAKEATRGIIEESGKDDVLLRGVTDLFGNSDVYEAYPPADVKVLMRGQVLTGMNPTDSPATYQKKNSRGGKTQGINDPMMPIAWTRLHNGGRVFYTSLGHPQDFQDDNFRRLVVNALFWTSKREVPKK